MINDKLELLNNLKKSFQEQLDHIYRVEKILEEKLIKSEEVLNYNKQNNIVGNEILKSLEINVEYNKQQLNNFRHSSQEEEKKYKALINMVEESIKAII